MDSNSSPRRSALHVALILDDTPTIEALLELGRLHADMPLSDDDEDGRANDRTASGHYPLHYARSAAMVRDTHARASSLHRLPHEPRAYTGSLTRRPDGFATCMALTKLAWP